MRVQGQSLGLGLAVASAATFGSSGTFGDSLMKTGWTPAAAVTVRIALAAALLTVPALRALAAAPEGWTRLRLSLPAVAGYGLVAVAGCQLFYFNAVEHLSVSVALLLEYSGTLLVVAWMWLRHGERPRRLTVAGAGAAIVGLVFVLNLTGDAHVDLVGLLWGAGAAVGLAVYFLLSSRGGEQLPPLVMAWAGMVVAASALALLSLCRVLDFRARAADVRLGGHAVAWWVPVVGIALVSTAIAYSCGIAAARRLGATVASFVGLAEVLFATLFAWLLLDKRPTPLQAVGGLAVLGGIVLVRLDQVRHRVGAEVDPGSRGVPEPAGAADPRTVSASG